MIDSFGYAVMSLDEVIQALQEIKMTFPHMAQSPVWLANCPPMVWPVKNVTVEGRNGRKPEILLYVERGPN